MESHRISMCYTYYYYCTDAITNLAATTTDTTVSLSWTAPNVRPGFLTGYTIVVDSSDLIRILQVVTSATIANLTSGTTHTFDVTPFNDLGGGAVRRVTLTTLATGRKQIVSYLAA